MGNQLTGLQPPPVVNAEDYFSDLVEPVRLEEELYGSRLFKVAKIRRTSAQTPSLMVVKIFPNPNVFQILWKYQILMQPYCHRIEAGYNLLFFNISSVSERCGMLVRDFIDQSLAERLCTRPFLCLEDKKWIAYQLLCAVTQLHSATTQSYNIHSPNCHSESSVITRPLCHGDIKAENVLLTSWGWVLLTDPAPFKPTWLPADNPSEFTRFFDTSRRRVCYLAPERFVELQASPTSVIHNVPSPLTVLQDGGPTFVDPVSLETKFDPTICKSGHDCHPESIQTNTCDYIEPGIISDVELRSHHPNKGHNIGGENRSAETVLTLQDGLAESIKSDNDKPFECIAQTSLDNENVQRPGNSLPERRLSPLNVSEFNPDLVPSMDLFSIGCVLLELFTDGCIAFTLADLLSYRRGDHSRLTKLIDQVPCEHSKSLITKLLSLDRNVRQMAEQHLKEQCGKAFPKIFYTHLTPYLQHFLHPSLNCPNSRIAFLRQTLTNFLEQIKSMEPENLTIACVLICNLITSVLRTTGTNRWSIQNPRTAADLPPLENGMQFNMDSTRLAHTQFEPLELNQIRFIQLQESGKIDALLCLLEISPHMDPRLILDRVIPFCMELTSSHHSGEVRSLALDAVTHIFKQVTLNCGKIDAIQNSSDFEGSFLTEYLFPSLIPLSSDPKPEVRLALARCLPLLADSTVRFLNATSLARVESTSRLEDSNLVPKVGVNSAFTTNKLTRNSTHDTDNYLTILRAHVQDRLVNLFSDPDPQVRLCLMNTTRLFQLASFFGRSRTNGTLLSHMITFLNFQSEPELRAAFYRQISPLATLIGAQSVTVLRSLLEQGLIDPDEIVIEACLQSLTHLLRRRLLSAPIAVSFLNKSVALTAHPTIRIRQSAVAFITAFARLATNVKNPSTKSNPDEQFVKCAADGTMNQFWPGICSTASVYARLVNLEVQHIVFRHSVNYCFTSDAVLLSSLQPPINRTVLSALITMVQPNSSSQNKTNSNSAVSAVDLVTQVLHLLQERKSSRAVTRSGETPSYTTSNDESVDFIVAKLQSLGLTELMESQLVNLSNLVVNLCRNGDRFTGRNQMSSKKLPKYQVYPISKEPKNSLVTIVKRKSPSHNPKELLEDKNQLLSLIVPLTEQYVTLLRERLRSGHLPLNWDSCSTSTKQIFGRGLFLHSSSMSSSTSINMDSANSATSSVVNLAKPGLMGTLVQGGAISNHNEISDLILNIVGDARVGPGNLEEFQNELSTWPDARPQGTLMAHLHEHRAGMLSLATHTSGRLLASCSNGDGTVKLWNCGFWPIFLDGYSEQTAVSNGTTNYARRTAEQSTNFNSKLAQTRRLPTRSSWTYSVGESKDKPLEPKQCRGLVWVSNWTHLVTIMDGKTMHKIDATQGRLSGLNHLDVGNSGRAVCLATSAYTRFPEQFNLIQPMLTTGGDANLITFATTGNRIIAKDLRVSGSSSSVWDLKQDRKHGLIRSLAMHSCHTWLVCGTSRGHIICWDLRYQRPIAYTEHPNQPTISVSNLQIVETSTNHAKYSGQTAGTYRTLIVAATDHHNEVTIWDLEASVTASVANTAACSFPAGFTTTTNTMGCLAATWAQPGNSLPMVFDDTPPYRSVKALLCLGARYLPTSKERYTNPEYAHLPTVISGGYDARIRYWHFSRLQQSCILTWSGNEEALPPRLTYRAIDVNGIHVINEEVQLDPHTSHCDMSNLLRRTTNTQKGTPMGDTGPKKATHAMHESSSFPVSGRLELRESTKGHKSIISDLSMLQAGQTFMVSASMDGVIKIWR